MMRQTKVFIIVLLLSIMGNGCREKTVRIQSPKGKIELQAELKNGELKYKVAFDGDQIIDWSELGLSSGDCEIVPTKILQTRQARIQEQWKPLFGKSSIVDNSYNETVVETKTKANIRLDVVFRTYDDGVAFRYEIPAQGKLDSLTIVMDRTTFRFPEDYICWAFDLNKETEDFDPKPVSQTKFADMPLLVRTPQCWVALNEASVFDFSMIYLRNDSAHTTMYADIGISACALPLKTPWRVIQIGKKAGDLIESNILVNLNEPCQIEDPSWIKPGKAMWDWRNHGDTINGFVYGINEASYKRLIDFAAGNSMEYVLFDADWYSEKGPQFPREDLNMPAIIDYARKRNVNVLLYLDRRSKGKNDWDLEEVLKTFQQWGAVGIKYGFLALEMNDRKAFVDTTRAITQLCAKYQMLVDFHDHPVHPGGEERTWPNRITLEYGHAQQDSRKSFGPSKAVTVPFVNGLNGPLDMANGFYDLNGLQYREKVDKQGLNSTVVGETARCLVNYSPLLILPDNGDAYNKKADLFRFIKEMPDTWDESRVLAGIPGEFFVVARRSGKSWFVAGNTNEEMRTLDIPLNFLGEGKYKLIKYLDAEDAHYKNNKESYVISAEITNREQTITIPMAPGGGFCMQLLPEELDRIKSKDITF